MFFKTFIMYFKTSQLSRSLVTHFCKTRHLVPDNFNILRDSTPKKLWKSHRIEDLFALLEKYVATSCKTSSQESGNFEQALLDIIAEEWHIQLNTTRAGTSFFNLLAKESRIPIITETLSQAIPTIFDNGIPLLFKHFSNAEYNFSAEQSVASNATNCNN